LDNFHASHSSVDDRTGCKLRTWRDASARCIGHNFDRDELCLPTDIVEWMKDQEAERAGTAMRQLARGMNCLRAHP
jgi:hypothetical protein